DVTADTVVRYANFPNLYVPGLKNIISVRGPIQTLLLAYNKDGVYGTSGPKQVVFPREVVQVLLNTDLSGLSVRWSDWDADLSDNVVFANRRENSSGTRLTQYVGIQRYIFSKKLFFIEDDIPEDHVRRGTGAMLTAINGADSNFGYAFVSGTAGNN